MIFVRGSFDSITPMHTLSSHCIITMTEQTLKILETKSNGGGGGGIPYSCLGMVLLDCV
jgi:hypothetical protein